MTIATGSQALAADVIKLGAGIFGDRSDGDVEIAGNPTTLTRDMFYEDLTVPSGKSIQTDGFRIFATTVTNAGTIRNNGNDGGSPKPRTAGAATTAGTLAASGAGGQGGAENLANRGEGGGGGSGGGPVVIVARTIVNTGTIESNGGDGADGTAIQPDGTQAPAVGVSKDPALGGNGGAGGAGVSSGAGKAGGTATAAKSGGRALPNAISLWETEPTAAAISGGGGGGGGGWAGVPAGGGGGGGGGGGVIVLIYENLTSGTEQALAGSKGTGTGGGNEDGVDGSVGLVISFQL